MSRFSDALERAGHDIPPAAVVPPVDATAEAQELVDFTTTPAAPPVLEPNPAASYRFAADCEHKMIVAQKPNNAVVEQYRRLAATLHHQQEQHAWRSVMITSAIASEGKTLTATNLALTLSHSYQKRVLLIDADLRGPSLHSVMCLPNETGLGDALRSGDLMKARIHQVAPNLSVLTAGRPDPDPMSGLISDAMRRLIQQAVARYSWVIVDTPPVAFLPDANLLAGMIDTTLLVVAANSTPYPLSQRAIATLGTERILGVVLNRITPETMASEYGYYHYYRDESRAHPPSLAALQER
jgi:capsular exopolysaccharide synthesis family protein